MRDLIHLPESDVRNTKDATTENPPFSLRKAMCDGVIIVSLTLVAAIVRWWYFTRTAGITHTLGVEETARLKLVLGLYGPHTSFPVLSTTGPFQMIVGKLGLFFHPGAYITRWISFYCGILSPALCCLALKNAARPVRFCAALAICISPAHIWFSTIGVAEALTIFLILAACLCYARAEKEKGFAFAWACPALLFLSAAFMTRFETWILAPVFFADALIRFRRKFAPLWIFVFAAPIGWLIYSKMHWQGYFSSVNLHQNEMSFREALNHARLAVQYLHEAGGWACEVLGAAGFLILVMKKKTRFIALTGISIALLEFAMIFHKELVSDPKYSRALIVWLQIYAGAFIAAAYVFLTKKSAGFRKIPPSRACIYQYLFITLLTITGLVSANPQVKSQLETTLVEQGGDFQAAGQLLEYIESQMEQNANEQFALLTSVANRNYIFLHIKAPYHRRLFMPQADFAKATEFIERSREKNRSIPDLHGFFIVTQAYGPFSPEDDLSQTGAMEEGTLIRIKQKSIFNIYRFL